MPDPQAVDAPGHTACVARNFPVDGLLPAQRSSSEPSNSLATAAATCNSALSAILPAEVAAFADAATLLVCLCAEHFVGIVVWLALAEVLAGTLEVLQRVEFTIASLLLLVVHLLQPRADGKPLSVIQPLHIVLQLLLAES